MISISGADDFFWPGAAMLYAYPSPPLITYAGRLASAAGARQCLRILSLYMPVIYRGKRRFEPGPSPPGNFDNGKFLNIIPYAIIDLTRLFLFEDVIITSAIFSLPRYFIRYHARGQGFAAGYLYKAGSRDAKLFSFSFGHYFCWRWDD